MDASHKQQVDFILDCLRKGEKRKEILAKLTKKWQSVPVRTFDRRLKVATDLYDAERKRIEAKVERKIAKEAEARKIEVMSVLERQHVLTQIATGKLVLSKPKVVDKQVQFIECVPDYNDSKAAIAELNKMDGSYTTNINHTVSGNNLLSWLNP